MPSYKNVFPELHEKRMKERTKRGESVLDSNIKGFKVESAFDGDIGEVNIKSMLEILGAGDVQKIVDQNLKEESK